MKDRLTYWLKLIVIILHGLSVDMDLSYRLNQSDIR